jgi:hypothetical protein
LAKRTRDRLDFLFEDASAGRALLRGLAIKWSACRRPRKSGSCYGPYAVTNVVDELVADRFDTLMEAMQYCLLCLCVCAAGAPSRRTLGSRGSTLPLGDRLEIHVP